MLNDCPKQENKNEIEHYEKEIAKFYFGDLQIVSIESIAKGNTDSFTQFVINDLSHSSRLNKNNI